MRMGPVILLVFTIGLVGWIAPGLKASDPAPAPPSAHLEPTASAAWFAGETVLPRAPDGHFYADAEVGQRSTHFLVDTGASIVVLTGPDARAIGLDWTGNELVRIGQGASGPVYGVPVHLERITLGGMEAHDVPAAIVPQGLNVSLLGQSFLSRIGKVRIEGERMMLGTSGS